MGHLGSEGTVGQKGRQRGLQFPRLGGPPGDHKVEVRGCLLIGDCSLALVSEAQGPPDITQTYWLAISLLPSLLKGKVTGSHSPASHLVPFGNSSEVPGTQSSYHLLPCLRAQAKERIHAIQELGSRKAVSISLHSTRPATSLLTPKQNKQSINLF